jgi:hypothetical protein
MKLLSTSCASYSFENESLQKSLAAAEERASLEDIEALKNEHERTSDSLCFTIGDLSSEKRNLMNSLAAASRKASREDVEALKDQHETAVSSLRSTIDELTSKLRSFEQSWPLRKSELPR